jgi:hypothetical protein
LGGAPRRPTPPQSRNVSYTTHLFNRFAMPSARDGLAAAGTSDIFNLIGNAIQQTTYPTSSRDDQARDLASSGTLVPPHLAGAERMNFVKTQRERLRTLLQAYESEAFGAADISRGNTPPRVSTPRQVSSRKPVPSNQDSYMSRSRSESEFEDLGYEPMPDPEHYLPREATAASTPKEGGVGWSNWIWVNYGEKDSAAPQKKNI